MTKTCQPGGAAAHRDAAVVRGTVRAADDVWRLESHRRRLASPSGLEVRRQDGHRRSQVDVIVVEVGSEVGSPANATDLATARSPARMECRPRHNCHVALPAPVGRRVTHSATSRFGTQHSQAIPA